MDTPDDSGPSDSTISYFEPRQKTPKTKLLLSVLVSVFVTTALVLVISWLIWEDPAKNSPFRGKNLIFIIADGFSPASMTFAREMRTFNSSDPMPLLPLDHYLRGTARTYASDVIITDSAAGATAYSCALKTYNGAIGVRPDGSACATFLEAAHSLDYTTGIVTNTRVTHATPGAFSSHVSSRNQEYDIAEAQAKNSSFDLLFGGGRYLFDERTDGQNLIQYMTDQGFHYVDNGDDLDSITELPALGLFARSHLSYEIDRLNDPTDTTPSLSVMVTKALNLLSQSGKPFVLVIEAGRIDHAGHDNDAATHYHEINEYMNTIEVIEDFVSDRDDTAVVTTSDHATGGISTGANKRVGENPPVYPEYTWYPEVLLRQNVSIEVLAAAIVQGADLRGTYLQATGLDLDDYPLQYAFLNASTPSSALEYTSALSDAINAAALIGWTTMSHTGIDVNVYQFGARMEEIIGVMENTFVAEAVISAYGLQGAMDKINLEYAGWVPPLPEGGLKGFTHDHN
jgi:alkaline phosphatase